MSETTTVPAPGPSLFARIVGIVSSPTATFQRIVAQPRAAGVLFLVCLVTAAATAGPLSIDTVRRAAVRAQVEQSERLAGRPLSAEQRAQMEAFSAYAAPLSIADAFIRIPVTTVMFSAMFWALFNMVLGGNATFGQVVAVNAHSQVITAVGVALGAPIQVWQGAYSPSGPFSFAALAPVVDAASGLSTFLSAVTFFGLWQTVVCGIGLAVLYRRRPAGIITALWVIHLGITALLTIGLSSAMDGNR